MLIAARGTSVFESVEYSGVVAARGWPGLIKRRQAPPHLIHVLAFKDVQRET
jgi:hypothetical protein